MKKLYGLTAIYNSNDMARRIMFDDLKKESSQSKFFWFRPPSKPGNLNKHVDTTQLLHTDLRDK